MMEHSHLCAKIQRLQAQADAKNDLRAELHKKDLQVQAMQKIVDIAVKMATSEDGHDYITSLIVAAEKYMEKRKCEVALPLLGGGHTICGNEKPCHMHG
jgi:hypothetical protein